MFEVFNTVGAKVYEQDDIHGYSLLLHKSDFAKGIYLYHLPSDKGETISGRLVVE